MEQEPNVPARQPSAEVTRLLQRWSAGDRSALDELMYQVLGELQRLARSHMRREREGHTLEPAGLVNEAFFRLVDQRQVQWANRAHFFAIASQAMRRVLVDHARQHEAEKRGAGAEHVTLSGVNAESGAPDVDVLWLHDALEELQKLNERQAKVVELRYFGGLSVEETADALGISPATVKREWSTARVWLVYRLKHGRASGS